MLNHLCASQSRGAMKREAVSTKNCVTCSIVKRAEKFGRCATRMVSRLLANRARSQDGGPRCARETPRAPVLRG
jgi:hypothetical protein